jgi:hypothetical protein
VFAGVAAGVKAVRPAPRILLVRDADPDRDRLFPNFLERNGNICSFLIVQLILAFIISEPSCPGFDPGIHHLRKSLREGDGLPGQARQ